MIRSMTGFARAEAENGNRKCVVEIRSLNHRFLDISARIPTKDFLLEKKIKDIVASTVNRGSVEVSLTLSDMEGPKKKLVADELLAAQFIEAAKKLKEKHSLEGWIGISDLLSLKDVLKYEEEEADLSERWALMEKAIKSALERLVEMRETEGKVLISDILSKLDVIEEQGEKILHLREKQEGELLEKIRGRISDALKDAEADSNRILTEAAMLADRSDISEEVIRLRSHLNQIRTLAVDGGPIGRKIEFILQELNREANTIGSKSTLYEISQAVVEIKSHIEKIREQAANVE